GGRALALQEPLASATHSEIDSKDVPPIEGRGSKRVTTRAEREGLMGLAAILGGALPGVHAPPEELREPVGALSRRERQVTARVAQGFTNRQIAVALMISERTAETYVVRILRKLGINSRVRLATWAVQ